MHSVAPGAERLRPAAVYVDQIQDFLTGGKLLCLALCVVGCGTDAPTSALPAQGPPLFAFLPLQESTAPIPMPLEVHPADINGDGRMDLIWNHKDAASNQIYFGLASADGTFSFGPPSSHSQSVEEGWDSFGTLAGKLNADAHDDLAWNHRGTRNKMWFAFADGAGNWDFMPQQERPERSWHGYEVLLADVNGDEIDDWVWNETSTLRNRTFIGVNEFTGFTTFLPAQELDAGDWSNYHVLAGDLNGDGRDDLVWNETTIERNRSYVGMTGATATLEFSGEQLRANGFWVHFQFYLGDVNGDGNADQIWDETIGAPNRIAVSLSNGDGSFDHLPAQDNEGEGRGPFQTRIADVNADGRVDILWNELGSSNRVYVGLGTESGRFDFSPPTQEHPETTDWSEFSFHVADVNGDSWLDLIWNDASTNNRIYVALARQQ